MHGTFTYIWSFLMVKYGKCIGKYTIHGSYDYQTKQMYGELLVPGSFRK